MQDRVNQAMLYHICRRLVNHLNRIGVEEAAWILNGSGPGKNDFLVTDAVNRPSLKQPLDDLVNISEKTFKVASKYLSDDEITTRLKKWMNEDRVNLLIAAIERIDASVGEIIEAITRNRSISEEIGMLYSPKERCLKVSLIRRFLSDKPEHINIAKQYIEVRDFYEIFNRLIFSPGSRGRIGSKSSGLFLAQKILEKEKKNLPNLVPVKVPRTWYITTDEVIHYLHYNNLEELSEQKYKGLDEIRIEYPHIVQMMKNSQFPPEIVKSLAMALDDLGDVPIIVRSSSLLEDQMGAAFSGKYKSLFLANQGSKQERLEALMDAVVEVYASLFNPDSIQYRSEKGLLDSDEEMGIMIQEVVGTRIGSYFLPVFAGVALSNNEFLWSPRLRAEDGLVRLVPGLGTRAVDRLSDDFSVLISPGQPQFPVNTVADEIIRYSPKKADVINLEKNTFETVDILSLIKEYGRRIPDVHRIVSVYDGKNIKRCSSPDIDFSTDDVVVTFEGLISGNRFTRQMSLILKTLQEKMGTPVDIEFAYDGQDIYLLQCRPQIFADDNLPSPIPRDVDKRDIVFSANRHISNGRTPDISYIVYVDPEEYNRIDRPDSMLRVGRAVGLLNNMLPKRQFILMGPGRWGSRDEIRKGVQVSYTDLNNSAAIIEIARRKSDYVPDLSFGTHFFQDLVETNIRYLPLYPDDEGTIFNEWFLTRSENILSELLPSFKDLENVVRVVDIPKSNDGKILRILMNAELGEALGYLSAPSAEAAGPKKTAKYREESYSDDFWRWRHYMAERIADKLDARRFGVKGLYLCGSVNNASSGPGSDIDLIVHFTGTDEQRRELMLWLDGWSQCLGEVNYLKTGYTSEGLLDIHIVTDEDIARRTSFAVKIGAYTDPATVLKLYS